MITLIVADHDTRDCFPALLESIVANTTRPYELIVVHDACQKDVCAGDLLRGFPETCKQATVETQCGFTRAMNVGMHLVAPEAQYVALLNADIRLPKSWDERLIAALSAHDGLVCVVPLTAGSATMGDPLKVVKTARRDIDLKDPMTMEEMDAAACAEFPAATVIHKPMVPFFCVVFPKWALLGVDGRAVGLLDDGLADMRETFGLGEDDDWCYRAHKAGYSVGVVPGVYVWHRGGAAFTTEHRAKVTARQMEYLARKHGQAGTFSHYK